MTLVNGVMAALIALGGMVLSFRAVSTEMLPAFGARTEELRPLTWADVDLTGNPDKEPPAPPHIYVLRSVRESGDTKTRKSRRGLALPQRCVDALIAQQARIEKMRATAGPRLPIIRPCWSGGVFVLVQGAAEAVASSHVEVKDPGLFGDRSGCGSRPAGCSMARVDGRRVSVGWALVRREAWSANERVLFPLTGGRLCPTRSHRRAPAPP